MQSLVGRSVLGYIALSLFRIDFLSVCQYKKGRVQYISALISHPVNKSISCIAEIYCHKNQGNASVQYSAILHALRETYATKNTFLKNLYM